jgi:hypothetical protein
MEQNQGIADTKSELGVDMRFRAAKLGSIVGEVCTLWMLYSAALLAPIPFGFARIGGILLAGSASFAFAYFATSRSGSSVEAKRISFKGAFSRPPFIVWFIVVAIIMLQLANALYMVHLANKT